MNSGQITQLTKLPKLGSVVGVFQACMACLAITEIGIRLIRDFSFSRSLHSKTWDQISESLNVVLYGQWSHCRDGRDDRRRTSHGHERSGHKVFDHNAASILLLILAGAIL
jgi:hypothetical protein